MNYFNAACAISVIANEGGSTLTLKCMLLKINGVCSVLQRLHKRQRD